MVYFRYLFLLCVISISSSTFAQVEDHAFFIKNIYNHTLTNGQCYHWLSHMSENIGGRLSGSENAAKAVDYTFDILNELSDHAFKQACQVPKWERNEEAIVRIFDPNKNDWIELNATSLGNSIGTNNESWKGEIVEVQNFEDLEKLGKDSLIDKIVFFNRPMNPIHINTGHAYGAAVDQRTKGASQASKYGAIAVLVRSMTTLQDDVPHTGVMIYDENDRKIPGIGISTNDANLLSSLLDKSSIKATISSGCKNHSPVTSYNVIGEIKGSQYPDSIILIGGHLDSWDLAGGAHDDGAGCVHAIQVFETLRALDYTPKHTLRCVMFMNEENGLAGGLKYAEESNNKNEFHLAAIESDSGGFTPRGFTCIAEEEVFIPYLQNMQHFNTYLEPYDLYIKKGWGGADIGPLKSQAGLLIGFRPDNQRYFDYHHSKNDNIQAVNQRELELGAAAITSLVYLIDQFGI